VTPDGTPEPGDLRAVLRPFLTSEEQARWMIQAQEYHDGRWRPWVHFSGATAATVEEAREDGARLLAEWRKWIADQETFDAMTEYLT
jgi:hypothetical protein